MENVKKVKAGELAIRNNDKEAVIKCCKFIWRFPFSGKAEYYRATENDFEIDNDINLPTILATELLKEIEAAIDSMAIGPEAVEEVENPKDPESRISELTAQKEAIEAEIEKLKAEKEDGKKFNAERALAGEPCETMNGLKVLAIHRNPIDKEYPLYACMKDGNIRRFTIDGFFFSDERKSDLNLKMS